MDKENQQLLLSDFDYYLPPELIAQTPLLKRDESKLLVVNRKDHSLTDKKFYDIIDIFQKGDGIKTGINTPMAPNDPQHGKT